MSAILENIHKILKITKTQNLHFNYKDSSSAKECKTYRSRKNNIENAVILEDDVNIPNNFVDRINNTFKSLEKLTWDFCSIARKPMDPKKDMEIIPNSIRPAYSCRLCGYIINLDGMKKIIHSNFVKNIIPMDQIIPLLGNISPHTDFRNRKYFFDFCKKIWSVSSRVKKINNFFDKIIIYNTFRAKL